jgi:hypothetical protein
MLLSFDLLKDASLTFDVVIVCRDGTHQDCEQAVLLRASSSC